MYGKQIIITCGITVIVNLFIAKLKFYYAILLDRWNI